MLTIQAFSDSHILIVLYLHGTGFAIADCICALQMAAQPTYGLYRASTATTRRQLPQLSTVCCAPTTTRSNRLSHGFFKPSTRQARPESATPPSSADRLGLRLAAISARLALLASALYRGPHPARRCIVVQATKRLQEGRRFITGRASCILIIRDIRAVFIWFLHTTIWERGN